MSEKNRAGEYKEPNNIAKNSIDEINLLKKDIINGNNKNFESNEITDSIILIIFEEFTSFCENKVFFSDMNEFINSYNKTKSIIEEKIKKINPDIAMFGIDSLDIKDYCNKKGFFFNINTKKYRIKGDNKTYIVPLLNLCKINKRRTIKTLKFFPKYLLGLKQSDVEILYVGKNLIKKYNQKIKEKLGYLFHVGGFVDINNNIIMFEEGINYTATQYSISNLEAEKSILYNEMGHIVFGTIFSSYSSYLINNMKFQYGNDKTFTVYQLNEALSDLTTLKYGIDSPDFFVATLNRIVGSNNILSYDFSNYIISNTFEEIMEEMKIKNGDIDPNDFNKIKNKFLGKLEKNIFGIIFSILDFLNKKSMKK